jgi:hypothetical protein
MKDEEYLEFLRSVLIKIENAINLLSHDPPRHILSYNKMLGVRQKINDLNEECKNVLFSQIVTCRSVINYFINGRYGEARSRIIKLKTDIIKICCEIKKRKEKNERDKNE